MIIFGLDGTLANCEHRRHFVDCMNYRQEDKGYELSLTDGLPNTPWKHIKTEERWKPDWKAFYEACDKDEPIEPMKSVFISINEDGKQEWQIWSSRCESVRAKTLAWLDGEIFCNSESIRYIDRHLKMRPIGDCMPDDQLKEKWLDEMVQNSIGKFMLKETNDHKPNGGIDFVFDDRKKVIDMWIRRGIFVFDVSQGKGDF